MYRIASGYEGQQSRKIMRKCLICSARAVRRSATSSIRRILRILGRDAQALQWRETLVDCPEKFSALELSKGNQQKVAFPMGRKGYALKLGQKFVHVFLCHNQVPCFDSCVRG